MTRALLIFAALILAAPAQAQTLCKERDSIVNVLKDRFGETQRGFGLQSDRRVLEVFASPSGSWTAILTLPGGMSCVVATGEAWNSLPPPPLGEPT